MTEPIVGALRAALADAADPARAEPMQRYMKSAMPFRGVPSPVADRLFRDAWAAHPLTDRGAWQAVVLELFDAAEFREERYAALFVLAKGKSPQRGTTWLDADTFPLFQHLISTGAWWDLVDGTAKWVDFALQRHRAEATPLVRAWITAGDLWLRRVSIIAQLRARRSTDLDLLTHAIEANLPDSLHGRDFFIRKAIGWSLREYAKTDADWVRSYVAGRPELSPLSVREALKHLG